MVGHSRLIRSLFAVFGCFFAALAGAHSIPEIPVHGRFQADGTAEISIEINPRSWAPSPAEAPSLEQRAWARLTAEQRKRYDLAKKSDAPVLIVTQAEAEAAEKNKAQKTKTWVYKATNVRDFAFATSRKFIHV